MKLQQHSKMLGFGLLELLIAMGLSVLLLAGVVTMFTSSRSSYETNERMARVQENGRAALDNMARAVKAAGYMGCNKAPEPGRARNMLNGSNDPSNLLATYGDSTDVAGNAIGFSVMGFDYTGTSSWSPALDTTWVINPAEGSDILLIREPIPGKPLIPIVGTASGTADISIAPVAKGSGPFAKYQIVNVSNCFARATFQITDYTPSTGIIEHEVLAHTADHIGNWTADMHANFGSNSDDGPTSITAMQTVIYYVRASTADPTHNSLWRRVDSNAPEELVDGIDSMQLLFGVDTNSDRIVDNYVKADAVTNFSDVLAVSIGILARSDQPYGTPQEAKTYNVLDANLDANATFDAPKDAFFRQIYQTTATVRNNAE